MLRRCRLLVCISVTALLTTAPAEAQRRGFGGMRPGNVSSAQLLMLEQVQAELMLTDEQKAQVRELNDAATAGRQKLFAEVAKERRNRSAKIEELEQTTRKEIEKVLNESQRKRLKELLLQANGAAELFRQEIGDALHLTDAQKKKLAQIRRENTELRRRSLANYDGDRTAKSVELQQEANAKSLDVLSEEQRNQFEAMQGKKANLDLFPS